MFRRLRDCFRSRNTPWSLLPSRVLEVRDLPCLMMALGWNINPTLDIDGLREFRFWEDLNERRLRDAEVIAAACCNNNPKVLLEIGTGQGQTTVLMAENAPLGLVYTVNIPPEETAQGGCNITFAPSRDEIGMLYKQKGLTNVCQILANTAVWEPDVDPIDVAFIDGCHDTDFVFNDTLKVLRRCRPGSIVLWHDFAPQLADVYPWIGDVCRGVERLCARRHLSGPILHLRDSWVGLYRVP